MECGGFEARRQIPKTPHLDDVSCSPVVLGGFVRVGAVVGSSALKKCSNWLRQRVATGHGGLNEGGGAADKCSSCRSKSEDATSVVY